MSRVSFTGPSRLSREEERFVRNVVPPLVADAREFATGGADGVDVAVADELLRIWPDRRHLVYVPAAPYARDAVSRLVALGAELIEVDAAPTRADAYRRRNEAMVSPSDRLVAVLRRADWYRSGEWMTVGIAKKLAIPVDTVVVRPPP